MNFARTLVKVLGRLFGPVSPEPVPARVKRQLAEDWIARNRCW